MTVLPSTELTVLMITYGLAPSRAVRRQVQVFVDGGELRPGEGRA